jgi:hypothetical protein
VASEFVALLQPQDFQRETDMGLEPYINMGQCAGNDIRGLVLPKYARGNLTAFGYTSLFRIPKNLSLATGLTFVLYLTDDGQNASDLGKVVDVGITLLDVTVGPSNFNLDTAATELATEVTFTATLAATTGVASITSKAVANAALPASVAAGDLIAIRLRRLGNNTADTCLNRVLVMALAVNNT